MNCLQLSTIFSTNILCRVGSAVSSLRFKDLESDKVIQFSHLNPPISINLETKASGGKLGSYNINT